jgi:hypothetical protein
MRQEPHPLKVVIRLLPPSVPEAIVWASVDAHLDSAAFAWRSFVQGKQSLRSSPSLLLSSTLAHISPQLPQADGPLQGLHPLQHARDSRQLHGRLPRACLPDPQR